MGDRRANLERAADSLVLISRGPIRVSSLYENPALIPAGAPSDWHRPFLNAAAEIEWDGTAFDLLKELKSIEKSLGRVEAARWAPRILDLDLLLFGNSVVREPELVVPHPEMLNRSFVLDPLKDLIPDFLKKARELKGHSPWTMAILNLTPDSFSDGGGSQNFEQMVASGVQAIDIGAESTRPGAAPVSVDEEWRRLEPTLEKVRALPSHFKPYISLDTRHAEVAARALNYGVDCINDVGGLSDPAMLTLLRESSCDYVLMHSLTVPADPHITLPSNCDPVNELKNWLSEKLELVRSRGIDLNRIIFDPGIGFGKTAAQSLAILERMNEFTDFPVRLLVGHSRKSFMKALGVEDRDSATLEISRQLARRGVNILRVHDFQLHQGGSACS